MRDEIIRRNTLITGISLFVFCIFSFMISSYYNLRSLESELVNISNVIFNEVMETNTDEELNKTIDSFTKNQEWLGIVVCNSLGTVVKDSENDSIGVSISEHITKEELERANSNIDKEQIYINNDKIYYIKALSEDIIIRTSIEYKLNTTFLFMNLFVMLMLLIIVLFVSIYSSKRISKNMVEILEDIGTHLKTINEGQYVELEDKHKYEEVENVLKEINEVNRNILNSMQTIKHEHSKMNFVINNMEQGIIIISENEEILLINDYARKILNVKIDGDENIDYHRVLVEQTLLSHIERALKNARNDELEINDYFDIINKKEEKVFATSINYSKNKWFDREEEIGIFIILLSDVTEKRANDELKAEFVANASHELKSPITSIKGFSELLLVNNEESDEKTKKYLNVIYKESIRMQDTIDELLYLSNLEYRRNIEGTKERVYFKDVIDDIVDDYSEKASKDNISIIVNVNDDLYIYEQTNLLNHLISNLVSNAIKYNKKDGSVYINVQVINERIVLTVADTGIGIDDKNISKIFERFYRVDQSRNRKTGGTGIGLNIVKQICNILDAKLSVESKKEIGTKFIVEFKKNME